MLKERASLVVIGSLSADLLAVAAAFLAAYWLRNDLLTRWSVVEGRLYPLQDYLVLLLVALTSFGFLLIVSGEYRVRRTTRWEAARLFLVCLAAALILLLWAYLFRPGRLLSGAQHISRIWFVAFTLLAFTLLAAEKLTLRFVLRSLRSRGYNLCRVLIAGSGARASKLVKIIERHRDWGFQIVGSVAEGEGQHELAPGCPYLGTFDEIGTLVEDEIIDEVIFVIGRHQVETVENLLLTLEELGVRTRLMIDLFPHARASLQIGELEGIPLLSFSTVPATPWKLLLKRLIDIAVATVLIILTAPLLALIALAVKLTSEGEVLFRQVRCGLNGRRFVLYKFRSMVAGADDLKQELKHLNEADGPVFKISRDPRLTRLGRWLRKSSLDELPQLWNVLKGDMSMVGPRPPVPSEVRQYERWQRRRLSMRPGLTCLWQISGRSQVGFQRWMELDLEYIDSWSLLLDLRILLRTLPAVISGRGAS